MNKARNFQPQNCALERFDKIRKRAVVDQKSPSKGKLAIERIFGRDDQYICCQFPLCLPELMPSLIELLSKWPLVRQFRERKDGTGLEAMSENTRALHARIDDAKVARSICPYCGVGCGQLIFHKDGKLVSIEGDPESPISQGNLCPKGAASYQLLTHSRRETKMKYRAPRAKEWSEISLERAMDMVADRVWESRRRTFVHEQDGVSINHTTAICHLGGATLDNEENYLIKKLFTGGLGMVCVSNQARI